MHAGDSVIEYHTRGLRELRKVFDPEVVDKAARSTVRRLSDKAVTRISRAARAEYAVKAADIKSHLEIRRINDGFERVLVYTGTRLGLQYFNPREVRITRRGAITTRRTSGGFASTRSARVTRRHRERRGVTVLIKRSEGRVQAFGTGRFGAKHESGAGAFMTFGRGVRIYARAGKPRLPIDYLTGPAIAQMVGADEVLAEVRSLLNKEAGKTFDHEMDYFLGRLA